MKYLKHLFIIIAASVSLIELAHATVWFGQNDGSGNAIIVGLSSGQINMNEKQNLGVLGHFITASRFVGIGAFAISAEDTEKVLAFDTAAHSDQEFISQLEIAYPDRRFIVGTPDGKLFATAGQTGCNQTNIFCGIINGQSFSIVGGGLVSEKVILQAAQTHLEKVSDLSFNETACSIIDAIVSAGGETKEFQYGVAWI